MGIPKFFRWLTRRYPQILQAVNKEEDVVPVDNLYLDLNGIVHNCVHGNDAKRHERISQLDDLEELWASIMRSIDEIVHLIKPKRKIFLAVDGVAPRAKMNQQRARRFKSARERALLKAQIEARGKQMSDLFDSNAISPGTKFMADLCKQLHFFVKYKLNTDPLYQGLDSCILSDGSVPGEGEHKMLDYIRQLRNKPDYDPNTRHCFYGADADLIMLSLLTHEPHFTIIREEAQIRRGNKSGGVQRVELSTTNNFQLIHISLLREYMMLEFKELNGQLRFRFDLERVIDDFVFFCFFIGNDFLPTLSTLDISEGSLDQLIEFYKKFLPTLTDYITNSGLIHWDRAEKFIELLASHEKQVFIDRVDSIEYSGKRNRSQQKTVNIDREAQMVLQSDGSAAQSLYRDALFAKKRAKVNKYVITQGGKKYKKYLLTKRFREDEDENSGKKLKDTERNALNSKLQALYKTQLQAAAKPDAAQEEESKEPAPVKQGLELIEELDEQYLSDLRPEEIPDDCVSDVDMSALENDPEGMAGNAQNNLLNAQAEIDAKAEEDNQKFIKDFVSLYSEDPHQAKRKYYLEKTHFDIDTDEGKKTRNVMMKKYLEGLQWVLYYYYKGSPHWRWYYPFHYAPMISDLGSNIVRDFLGSKTVINEFEVDFNCPAQKTPYTPFQQLLCIMPLKSFRLLPDCYESIARGDLIDYFPEDFPIDLNGKTVAWEALVLIPFVDENLFIQKEKEMLTTMALSAEETNRNQSSFIFYAYQFNSQSPKKPLQSTLTHLKDLPSDQSNLMIQTEYENVGQQAFEPKILRGVKLPSPGYPSFKTLGVIDFQYRQVYAHKKHFDQLMVIIPQCIEEFSQAELRKYILALSRARKYDVYVDFPYQRESIPIMFEDSTTQYFFEEDASGNCTVQMATQQISEKEWINKVNRIKYKLEESGICVPLDQQTVLAHCTRLSGIFYNAEYDNQYYQKEYEERPVMLPLSLMMRVRSPEHYMNVDTRVLSPDDEIKPNAPLIVSKLNLYGLIGRCRGKDRRSGNVKIAFDKEQEFAKVHDPFVGRKAIEEYQRNNQEAADRARKFFGEQEIDTMLQLKSGLTAALTNSFMIKFRDPDKRENVLIDIGLNIKSWTKKQHVPGFVRFSNNQKNLAANQAEGMMKGNEYQRAQRHVRPHWEYSADLVNILREYQEQFPEVFESALKARQKNSMPTIKDIFFEDSPSTVNKLKAVGKWIEALPISNLPFVDMGFDTLESSMISSINSAREHVAVNMGQVNLGVKASENMPSKFLYAERFPYWTSLFPENRADKFKVGDRVLNLRSTRRDYVPFGARATVVGKTDSKVIVLFDEQFLQGSDINGQCEQYRGAILEPTELMNITRKFENQAKKNGNSSLVEAFTEPEKGVARPSAQQSARNQQSQGGKRNDQAQQQLSESPQKDDPQYSLHLVNNQEERKEGQQPKKQYRMKQNQQRAYDQAKQQQQRQTDSARQVEFVPKSSYEPKPFAAQQASAQSQGASQANQAMHAGGFMPSQTQQQQPEEIPQIQFKAMSDLPELMAMFGQGQASSFQPGQAPLGGALSNPSAPQMSQQMVSLESPPFVPGQKPAANLARQVSSESNPNPESGSPQ